MGEIVSVPISCRGGLDLRSNSVDLLDKPGFAKKLQNFEASIKGGYRRINGFTAFGGGSATTPAGTVTKNLGVFRYADGVVACQDTGVYFSTDGITWIQVNKTGATAGLDVTALGAAAALPRTGQDYNQISIYEGNTEFGTLILTDGVNKIAQFKITDTGGRKYYYEELGTAVAAPQAPQWNCVFQERSITAGDVTTPTTVYWSTRFNINDYTGASAGYIDVGDKVEAVRPFRNELYVFCKNSIHKIINIDTAPERQTITRNVGCLSGHSVQEIAGDLVFLAPDGIRTVAGTTRVDDVELGSISGLVQPLVQHIAQEIDIYHVKSTVIREKNQYRLYYSDPNVSHRVQRGIIGTLALVQGVMTWQWSETRGIEVSSISSEMDASALEKIYHGDFDGNIFLHDTGTSFNGETVEDIFQTPDIGYGDRSVRKTLHNMELSIEAESTTNTTVAIKYDFGSARVHNPNPYAVETVNPAAIYGTAVFGSSVFGSVALPEVGLRLEGSGNTNSFTFSANDDLSVYTIQGFHIELIPAARTR